MSIYVISDLHLSTNETTNKSMEKFGTKWRDYHKKLEKNFKDRGIEHKTMYPGGGHTWMNCRDYITAVAQLLFK